MDYVFNTKTGGKFNALCDRSCTTSPQQYLAKNLIRCSNCGLMYSSDVPHPLAKGILNNGEMVDND